MIQTFLFVKLGDEVVC